MLCNDLVCKNSASVCLSQVGNTELNNGYKYKGSVMYHFHLHIQKLFIYDLFTSMCLILY